MDLLYLGIALLVGFFAGLVVSMWVIEYKINKGQIPRFLLDLGLKKGRIK